MAYTAYKTWAVGEILTAANMNAQVRDNGLLGPEALATAAGEIWIATGANVGNMVAILDGSDRLKHEYGGLEFNASAVTTGDIVAGQSAGVMGLNTPMTQAQAEGGTDTTVRGVTAERVKQAIEAWRKVIRKTADETVNNSATLQDDDDLTFAVAANETWAIQAVLFYSSGTTPDLHANLSVPSGATVRQGHVALDSAVTTFTGAINAFSDDGTAGLGGGGAGGSDVTYLYFAVVENAGNAGNITLQWAQQVANASNTIVRENSFMVADRIS